MKSTLRIGLQVNSVDPFWVEVRETIWRIHRGQQAETAAGQVATGGRATRMVEVVEVEAETGRLVGEDHAARVEEIMALELDAVILAPESLPLVHRLLERKLPVVALHHREITHPLFVCPEGLYSSARMVCEYLAQQLQGSGRVLIVGGAAGNGVDAPSSRVQAAWDVFAEWPGIQHVHAPAPWDRSGAYRAVHLALQTESKPFDGVFGLSDTLALVGRDVLLESGMASPGLAVVGVNGDPLAIAAIAEGAMTATVVTSASELARDAFHLACAAANGERLPSFFTYHPQLVTAQNVANIGLQRLIAIADLPSQLVGVNRQMERQRLVQMETSLAINRRIGSILDQDALPHEIAELIRENYGYDHVQVVLWLEREHVFAVQQPAGAELQGEQRPGERLTLSESGPLGRVLLGNRAIFIPDTASTHRFSLDPRWPQTRARALLPIRLGNKTLGVLDLHSVRTRAHVRAELDALQSLADQLGVAMRNAQLYYEALASRAEAEHANLLKTRLLANISHELRAPLNVVLGYAQTALNEPNPYGVPMPGELLRDIGYIQRSGQQLERLINDLLDVAQAETGVLEIVSEEVDTHALLWDVFESVAGSLTSAPQVEWRLELPANLPVICADSLRLRQVLFNLLHNAHRFTHQGHITLGAALEETELHIWVEDSGEGIPSAAQGRVFEAFYTVENDTPQGGVIEQRRTGLGLGLSVTQHLVKLHGGHIHMEGRPGCGAICHVYLPIATSAEPAASSVSHSHLQSSLFSLPLESALESALRHSGSLVEKIVGRIQANYAVNPSRQEIAAELGISPNYMTRIFREQTGMSPWEFLNRYRIVQAQKLLLNSNRSMTEIANQVGFGDPAYFSRIFRKETGHSPQHFRKNAAAD